MDPRITIAEEIRAARARDARERARGPRALSARYDRRATPTHAGAGPPGGARHQQGQGAGRAGRAGERRQGGRPRKSKA